MPQCKCRTKLKNRCKRQAKPGFDFCAQHLSCAAITNTKVNTTTLTTTTTKVSTKKNTVAVFVVKNQGYQLNNSRFGGKLYRVTARIKIDNERTDGRPSPPVSVRELYQYFCAKDGVRIKGLIDDISMYQMKFNTKEHSLHLIANECVLTFLLSPMKDEKHDRNFTDDKGRKHLMPMVQYIENELKRSADGFGDGCYGGAADNECHYPYPDGSYSEIHLRDIKVTLLEKVVVP